MIGRIVAGIVQAAVIGFMLAFSIMLVIFIPMTVYQILR
ncbi:hypothetical protein LCGC14_0666600 [marine sediment metagenome]|uniref:Uncharacterized protein n=1 Tax=marine sediment metagenome TaxID=412755 RepID=A0A0F9TDH8_9ZZZZ